MRDLIIYPKHKTIFFEKMWVTSFCFFTVGMLAANAILKFVDLKGSNNEHPEFDFSNVNFPNFNILNVNLPNFHFPNVNRVEIAKIKIQYFAIPKKVLSGSVVENCEKSRNALICLKLHTN